MNELLKQIMNIQKTKYLYKYRPINKYTYDMLKEGYLWCDSVRTYNDPYEGHFSANFLNSYKEFIIDSIKQDLSEDKIKKIKSIDNVEELKDYLFKEIENPEYKKIVKTTIESKEEYLQNAVSEVKNFLKDSYKVCSLSETFDNTLMWSHYAHNHEGICLRYNSNDFGSDIYKVNYSNNVLNLSSIKNQLENENQAEIFTTLVNITKDSLWNYEKEWRIVLNGEDNKYKIKPNAIYLGSKMSACHKKEIISIAREKSIAYYELELCLDKYKLKLKNNINTIK